ncbi:DEAD/DEAH box helicase [Spongiactinospora sp. TRM90649]|uniref:DEAD/DEAH box helicase n=1 Tax=Spongiactinospora sp. TRM90649 TaxID=3031114 RepID=UPI0023F67310|nr:DEAD/DEAH box helicase [Spongiactinospora sp. TRM90649]MDF5756575.1 Helicase associated domain protein [Spongiactinospora sp. TRM90649]
MPTTFNGPSLWPHQRDAANATVDALTTGGRATVVMPCGTGKTRTGAAIAARLLADHATARVLIVAPFLELITQTIAEWRRLDGQPRWDRIIACCSDPSVARSQALHGEDEIVTSEPQRLAHLAAAPGRTLVAVTYHSLHVVAEAHGRHAAPSWDLILIDEAHRSVGRAAKPWAVIHDDDRIPSARRLYMTATPKVLLTSGDDVVSMDDKEVFGPRVYQMSFGEARKGGLLADYRVIAPIITDEQVRAAAQMPRPAEFYQSGRSALSPAVLATQIAVLRAAHQYDIRRLITFHNLVTNAKHFAGTLPHAQSLLDPGERTDLCVDHVHGTQSLAQRRAALDRLREDDEDLVVISNARVLGEGIDVPAVDAVAFIDSRNSPIDTIQAIGRALRRGARPGPKTASVIIPVILGPGDDPETALQASAYAPLWQIVRALATHDEDLTVRLTEQRRNIGGDQTLSYSMKIPEWLHISGVPVPDGFASAITVQTVRCATSSWEEKYGACSAYYAKHGDLLVPHDYRTADDEDLGGFIHRQRTEYQNGVLSAGRIALLEAIGMVWRPNQHKRDQLLAELRAFHAEHKHLRIPRDYKTSNGFPLGRAYTNLRFRRRQTALDPEYVAALEEIGVIFEVEQKWKQFVADLKDFRRDHGHLDVPQEYLTSTKRRLGRQVNRLRRDRREGNLSQAKITTLDRLGFIWSARDTRWYRNLSLLLLHGSRDGQPTWVKQSFTTPDGDRIGTWFHNQLEIARRGQQPTERVKALRAAGVDVPDPLPHRSRKEE